MEIISLDQVLTPGTDSSEPSPGLGSRWQYPALI